MNKISHLLKIVFDSPLVWGILGSVGFYGLIFHGPLNIDLVKRYFTKHPVEYMETVLFAIGLAALILKALDIAGQRSTLAKSPLGPKSQAVDPADACHALLQRLDQVPQSRQEEFFIRRLRSALEHVRSHGSAETLNDELKYLADIDASRLHTGFGLFRVILWAVPILGFLGTVVGITMALNSVDLKSPDQSMLQVLNGLGLKFDTTAVALSMSMVLMFVHFFVDRSGNGLLEQVDRRVEQELSGRWQHVSSGSDGQLTAVRRMAETMIQTSERLVQRQAELWQSSMENAAARWANMAKVGGEQLQAWLAGALSDSLKTHAQHLAAAEQASIQANRQYWEKIIQTQAHGAQNLATLQASVTRQVEVIQQAVAAVGEVARLEDALNRNLSALAGAKHFEQTVMSLAAAINLLGARLAEMPAPAAIKLDGNRRAVQAA
ncbi:MAG: MotA/TolQ/ExbB proton channel family protein [Thermoguttaceae bacterium]